MELEILSSPSTQQITDFLVIEDTRSTKCPYNLIRNSLGRGYHHIEIEWRRGSHPINWEPAQIIEAYRDSLSSSKRVHTRNCFSTSLMNLVFLRVDYFHMIDTALEPVALSQRWLM